MFATLPLLKYFVYIALRFSQKQIFASRLVKTETTISGMTPLEKIIIERIKENGPMNMADYMRLCLGHPEYGYYMTRDPFGKDGDFITAPEISQIFGELIGIWIADCWIKLGRPDPFILLECGPGRGTLMADALRATKKVEGLHDAMQLHLLETSPVLKKKQADALAQYEPTWHDVLGPEKLKFPTIIIGNEFLDALPVRQLNFNGTDWLEITVNIDINDTLRLYQIKPEKAVLDLIPKMLIEPHLGDHLEVSHEQKCFVETVSYIIEKQGGAALFVDYGSVHLIPSDTVQAVKNHHAVDVLHRPGEVDITSHVQFAEITRIAMENNMTVHGPASQSDFLKRLGIEVRAEVLKSKATQKQSIDIHNAVQRLIGTEVKRNEMGVLFKVMALSADPHLQLEGFA